MMNPFENFTAKKDIHDIANFIYYSSFNNKEVKAACEEIRANYPHLMNQYVGFIIGFDNYAWGVTGTSYFGGWVVNNDKFKGFDKKGDVRRYVKDTLNIIVGKMKKTRYGYKGYDKIFVIKVKAAIEWYEKECKRNYRIEFINNHIIGRF